MASQSKAVHRTGALCAGAGAAALALSAAASTAGFTTAARTLPPAPTAGAPAPRAGARETAQRAQGPSGAAALACSGVAAAAGLAARAAARKSRRTRAAKAGTQRSAGACPCAHGKKTACLHPDKPMMFACADCPRRSGAMAQADLDGAEIAAAAFFGEGACDAAAKKTQCLHPDKPAMFACADCPRRSGKAGAAECDASAAAAYVAEGVVSGAKKTQCLHPDKPEMFACSDCPRRAGKTCAAAVADCDSTDVAVAAYVGEGACGAGAAGKKSQCLHPDKPMMFACADCPRRGGKAAVPAQEELDVAGCAAAAYVGECPAAGALGKKTQCLHPDKPMMFACADCPRRGGKAPAADEADLGGAEIAAAAFLGEGACACDAAAKKTQCLHPDKPAMFACADCPRRSGKAGAAECDASAAAAYVAEGVVSGAKKTQCLHPDKPAMFACSDCPRRAGKTCAAATADFDGVDVAAAAYVGEGACGAGAVGKKSQCLHPDKPMMFACADCPRRGGKAAVPAQEESEVTGCAAAAYVGECPGAGALGKKTQCLHPDKPMMFACADCPRKGGKAPVADEGAEIAAAAFVGEDGHVLAKKTQCLHPDKPMMFACADCPRRGGKAPVASMDGEEVAAAAYAGECGCEAAAAAAKKTQCLHPDKPMMFACADCPRRGGVAPEMDLSPVAAAAFAGEGAAAAKKTQCLHPDKPMMFACADCPRRGGVAPVAAQAELEGEAVAAAAYAGECGCGAAKKSQCLHPDKPMMFACADCPRRGGKACDLDTEDPEMAIAAFVGESASAGARVVAKKDRCLHPDKPMMFACADCPRRG